MLFFLTFLLFIINKTYSQDLNLMASCIAKLDHDRSNICTSFCYKEDSDNYYFLSAGHCIHSVFEKNKEIPNFDLELRHSGKASRYIDCFIVLKWEFIKEENKDIAVLSVSKDIVKDYPKINPFEIEKDENIKIENNSFWTFGHPMGNWPTAFKGNLLFRNENTIRFHPPVIFGRSGSPLFNYDGTKILGIASYTVSKNSETLENAEYSVAVPFWLINKFLQEHNLE